MEEKVLTKSQSYNVKKLFFVLIAIGLVASLIWGGICFSDYADYYNEEYPEIKQVSVENEQVSVENEHEHLADAEVGERHVHNKWCFAFEYRYNDTWSSYDLEEVSEEELKKVLTECPQIQYGNAFSYAMAQTFGEFYVWTIPLAAMIVIGGLLFLWLRSYELTVTDKRVYGKVVFGKRVDLPIDSVSATATIGLFKGVAVSTSSGKISFLAIKNADEIFETVNKLLVARQGEKKEVAAPVVATTDEADQLQKFKKLLDDGVITQEEFDAKKKQILGL